MNVSAIIVTRGDVDLAPVLDSLPDDWEQIVWDNSSEQDLSVYGRYAAIEEYASHDLIYVQDDDVIVSDPQAIVDEWDNWNDQHLFMSTDSTPVGGLVANMPQEFRHDGYTDSCLVGFGAAFHRDLPARAFSKFMTSPEAELLTTGDLINGGSWFNRTCDVVFTTLTTRVFVDVPITHREFASDPDRMWKQPNHVSERARMLELARAVRDGRR